mmetsp:Transcript_6136/g.18524  ORF Transcript_6136/g.18524 Transcript_6136/m.18524 type:complete len:222 (-) Transcript_6136:2-667(-)
MHDSALVKLGDRLERLAHRHLDSIVPGRLGPRPEARIAREPLGRDGASPSIDEPLGAFLGRVHSQIRDPRLDDVVAVEIAPVEGPQQLDHQRILGQSGVRRDLAFGRLRRGVLPQRDSHVFAPRHGGGIVQPRPKQPNARPDRRRRPFWQFTRFPDHLFRRGVHASGVPVERQLPRAELAQEVLIVRRHAEDPSGSRARHRPPRTAPQDRRDDHGRTHFFV